MGEGQTDSMPNADSKGAFTVIVADNFHYMDESESYELGKFETLEAAIEVSKRIVDEYLAANLQPGMTADKLYEQYRMFGEDPYILGCDDPVVPFSAWDYAKERCAELCKDPA